MEKHHIEFLLKLLDKIELGYGTGQPRPQIIGFCKEYPVTKEDIMQIKKFLFSIL